MNSPNLESDISISTVYTQQIMAQFNDLNILNISTLSRLVQTVLIVLSLESEYFYQDFKSTF